MEARLERGHGGIVSREGTGPAIEAQPASASRLSRKRKRKGAIGRKVPHLDVHIIERQRSGSAIRLAEREVAAGDLHQFGRERQWLSGGNRGRDGHLPLASQARKIPLPGR